MFMNIVHFLIFTVFNLQSTVVIPNTENGVLLGSAMLGAVAAGKFSTIENAQNAMSNEGTFINPNAALKDHYDQKTRQHFKLLNQKCSD